MTNRLERTGRGRRMALVTVATGVVVKLALDRGAGLQTQFVPLFAAVLVTAWLEGQRPGMVAAGLATLAGIPLLFFPQAAHAPGYRLTQPAHAFVFFVEAAALGLVAGAMRPHPRGAQARPGPTPPDASHGDEPFRLMVESVKDYAIFMLDAHGCVATWNRGAERIKGYRASEILGRHFSCFYPEEEIQRGKPQYELQVAAAEGRFEDEGWRLRKDGSRFWANVVITALRDAAGNLRGFAKVTRDITQRREAQEEICRAKEFSERLIHSSIDGVLAFDRDCRYTVWNPALELFFGVARAQALGRPAFELPPFNDDADPQRLFRETLAGKVAFMAERPYTVAATGHQGYFEGFFSPLRCRSGEIVGGLAIIHDVAERRRAEAERARALREQAARAAVEASEQWYRTLAEAIPHMVWTAAPDGRFDFVNQRWCQYTGVGTAPSVSAGMWKAVVHPGDAERCQRRWDESVRTGDIFEIEARFRRASDATYGWHLARAWPLRDRDGKVLKWFGTCTEIDERKRAEDATRFLAEASNLLASSLDYETTLASVGQLAVSQIADRCVIDMVERDGSLRRLVVDHSEATGETIDSGAPSPADCHGPSEVLRTGRPEMVPEIADLMAADPAASPHLQTLRQLGLHSYFCVPLTARGRILGVITLARSESSRAFGTADLALVEDLARRAAVAVDNARLYREAHEALTSKDQAMSLLDTLLARAPVGFAFLDNQLRYVRINDALAAMHGVAAADHLGCTAGDVLPRELADKMVPPCQRVLETGEPVLDIEVSGQTHAAPGVLRYWQMSYYPVRSQEGEALGLGVVVIEITERKRFEEELRRAKEAAEAASRAKDEFLAVLSHELRTPLTPVLAAVSAGLEERSAPQEVQPVMAMIRRNVELEARLIDDLLDITRITRGTMYLRREVVDAHAVIHRALEICRGELHSANHQLVLELNARQHHVRADPARLQQAFWNLIKNAIKFTPPGGTVTIRTHNTPVGTGAAESRLLVEICDTGVGFEPAALTKMFKLFAQRRSPVSPRSGGLGLGLFISLSVVEAHGGRLTATSPGPGQGAAFHVDLAALAPRVAGAPAGQEAIGPIARGPLKILLVEDHPDTARTMARLLERLHFDVTTADTMLAALEMAAREEFDLLISDIGLPDGSGLELMRHLRGRRALKGIALSGYGMDVDVRKSQEAGFAAHLTKPIDFPKLEAVIHQVATGADGDGA